jgi:hypothetical protein
MKRIVCLMLIVLALCSVLCGCGNENWGIGNYTYTHVRVGSAGEGYCATVSSWHDNELGAELHTEEFGSIYCSEGTYVMFEDGAKCPFCRG